jgi:hypothetical protein
MNRSTLALALIVPLVLQGETFDVTADLGIGFRVDSFEVDKNIHYELFPVSERTKWKDLDIWEGVLRAEVDLPYCSFLYLFGKYGWVTDGRLGVEDRYLDQPSLTYLEASSNHVDGNVYDLRAALGYRFYSCCNSLMVAPLVGYAYVNNHYKASYGTWGPSNQDYLRFIPFCSDLSNRYSGVWIGFEATYDLMSCLKFYGSIQYDWMQFRASGHEDYGVIKSDGSTLLSSRRFQDRGNAHGPLIQVGLDLSVSCNFYVGTLFEWRYLNTSSANEHLSDRVVFIEEDLAPQTLTENLDMPLEHVQWDSWSIQLHAGVTF